MSCISFVTRIHSCIVMVTRKRREMLFLVGITLHYIVFPIGQSRSCWFMFEFSCFLLSLFLPFCVPHSLTLSLFLFTSLSLTHTHFLSLLLSYSGFAQTLNISVFGVSFDSHFVCMRVRVRARVRVCACMRVRLRVCVRVCVYFAGAKKANKLPDEVYIPPKSPSQWV